jgi:transposase
MTPNPREQRGIVIAATSRIKRKSGSLWTVPSQQSGSGNKPYLVNLEKKTCTCLDHQEAGHKCKHIYAAEIVYQREFEFNADGSVTETQTLTTVQTVRKTYPQHWPSYNAAQVNEKAKFQSLLHDLCEGIDEEPQVGRGRPRIPLRDAIFAVCLKVYSTVSGRRCMSDMAQAKENGYIDRLPCYNSIFNVLEKESTTAILEQLVVETSNPLKAVETKFAVDSSGFSGCRFDRWFDHKWGDVRSIRVWTKAHIMVGCTTNVITACEVSHAGDSPTLPKLLSATASRFEVSEVSADMAYSSAANLQAVDDVGATALIPFKKNAVGDVGRYGSLWGKMFHYFQFKRDEFLSRYHNRSNVESTFSMLKAKFGDSVRSKTDTAMKNEVLAKIVCHNIVVLISAMYELNLDPIFWAEKPVAQINGAAS